MLGRVLESVQSSPIDKVWIVDHSPTDALKRLVPESGKFVYEHTVNKGYGAGNNGAMLRSINEGYDYHLVLNPDVYWDEDVIEPLRAYMDDNRDVGLVMPMVKYTDNTFQLQAKLLPRPQDLIMKRLLRGKRKIERMRNYELRNADWWKEMNVPFLSGCFMFFRNSALREVGLFDERFFMYHEDMDLCRRMHSRYRTMYNPQVCVYHKFERQSAKDVKLFTIHIMSMVKYFNKWGWFRDKERDSMNKTALEKYL